MPGKLPGFLPDFERLREDARLHVDAIVTIFSESVLRVLGGAWSGFREACNVAYLVVRYCSWAFWVLSFFAPETWVRRAAAVLLFLYIFWPRPHLCKLCAAIRLCVLALFYREPLHKDPLETAEGLAGGLLEMAVYLHANFRTYRCCVANCTRLSSLLWGLALVWFRLVLEVRLGLPLALGIVYGILLCAWKAAQQPLVWRVLSTAVSAFRGLHRAVCAFAASSQVRVVLRRLGLSSESLNTSSRAPLYSYQPLSVDLREIRLLEVTKSSIFASPSYRLVAVPLSSAPPYDAMSYRWEQSATRNFLRFPDGAVLPVGHKVEKMAREWASAFSTSWLWIDAVCINQSDAVEKRSQIGMMGDIYRNARRTVVWLNDEPVSSLGLALMHLLSRHVEARQRTVLKLSALCKGLPGFILGRMWRERTRFLCQNYWTRGWIVQEVALAKRVHILYGGQVFPWDYMASSFVQGYADNVELRILRELEVLSVAALEEESRARGQPLTLTSDARGQIASLAMIRAFMRDGMDVDMPSLLFATLDRECTESQDKVLSLLGMLSDPAPYLGQSSDTVRTYFRNTARQMLATNPDFVFQCAGAGYPANVAGLPSWVPDWSAISIFEQNPSRVFPDALKAVHHLDDYHCGSSPRTRTPPQSFEQIDQEGEAYVLIRGVSVASLAELSQPCIGERPKNSARIKEHVFFRQVQREVLAMMGMETHLPERYAHSRQTSKEAFARTLVGDKWSESPAFATFPAPTDAIRGFSDCKQFLDEALSRELPESAFEALRGLGSFGDLVAASSMSPEACQSAVNYMENLAVRGKRIALTEAGHICLVPHLSRVGDLVVAVPGLQRPLLVRASKLGIWTLIGSCFVHGIMSGEIWDGPEPTLKGYVIE